MCRLPLEISKKLVMVVYFLGERKSAGGESGLRGNETCYSVPFKLSGVFK